MSTKKYLTQTPMMRCSDGKLSEKLLTRTLTLKRLAFKISKIRLNGAINSAFLNSWLTSSSIYHSSTSRSTSKWKQQKIEITRIVKDSKRSLLRRERKCRSKGRSKNCTLRRMISHPTPWSFMLRMKSCLRRWCGSNTLSRGWMRRTSTLGPYIRRLERSGTTNWCGVSRQSPKTPRMRWKTLRSTWRRSRSRRNWRYNSGTSVTFCQTDSISSSLTTSTRRGSISRSFIISCMRPFCLRKIGTIWSSLLLY